MITQSVICNLFDQKSRFIDYGGGHGLFVRMMRDLGFDFYWFDKYCSNIFSKEFVADVNGSRQYELLTAFEVFEHMVDPRAEIGKMLEFSESILFSTNLIPMDHSKSKDWWYYGTEHGQHVSFFSLDTLKFIAAKSKLNLYTNGSTIHLLTPKKISSLFFRVFASYKVSKIYGLIFKRVSLVQSDYQKILSRNQPGR
jgi:2-polyprenyl-3-methyl-5-hydroxy-6-metoxy-1,4-benzoquinol methylase